MTNEEFAAATLPLREKLEELERREFALNSELVGIRELRRGYLDEIAALRDKK